MTDTPRPSPTPEQAMIQIHAISTAFRLMEASGTAAISAMESLGTAVEYLIGSFQTQDRRRARHLSRVTGRRFVSISTRPRVYSLR